MSATISKPAKLVKAAYRRSSLWLFGNTIGFRVNILYALYRLALKLGTGLVPSLRHRAGKAGREDIERMAQEIRARGFAKVDPVLSPEFIRMISRKVDALFAREDKTVTTLQEGGLIRLKAALVEAPELEQLLLHPTVSAVLERYFGSFFKVYSCDVYRTLPQDPAAAAEKFGSLKWHFDNCPSVLFKIMIYLTDTTVDTGAISLVPKAKSQGLKHCGFWDRDKADSFADEIGRNAVYLEGAAGTTLFFSTHYCIHKATLPMRQYRDVAVFLVQPAFQPQEAFSPRARETYSFNFGYCVNPFTDAPLRYGDE
jgi:hypothetical protein